MDGIIPNSDKIIKFSIDAIYRISEDVYGLRIIPDINSKYYPPHHLRTLAVSPVLLEESFYNSTKEDSDNTKIRDFKGVVIQGGYYETPGKLIKEHVAYNMGKRVLIKEDIFSNYKEDSPYPENIREKRELKSKDRYTTLSEDINNKLKSIYLYCFNVGQGDTFLLITTNGNSYIIDTNFYSEKKINKFSQQVKGILKSHGLDEKRIKCLIITHKHIDHLRGADQLINSDFFNIENFMINLDYSHPTKCVNKVLTAASEKIKTWININSSGVIKEGLTKICIKNPNKETASRDVAPNINDSSICLCVEYKNCMLYLTGDAGYQTINKNYFSQERKLRTKSVLKVSHHGSITGTNSSTLKVLQPLHAFISVGDSRNYNHPHKETLENIRKFVCPKNVKISKNVKKVVEYELDGDQVILH